MTTQFIRVQDTLVDVLQGDALQRFQAVRAGSASLQIEDLLTFSAKAVYDEDAESWAIIEPIQWNSVDGSSPIRLRHVPGAIEIPLPN